MSIKSLKVYIQDNLAGYLYQLENARLQFKYLDDYCGIPLSVDLKVRSKAYSHKEVYDFLENLLPEQLYRTLIAKNHKVSERNVFSLLSVVGKECAGAISFYKEGEEYKKKETFNIREFTKKNKSHLLDGDSLNSLIEDLENNNLSNEMYNRMSLAGAQPKIVLLAMESQNTENLKLYDSSEKIPSNVIVKVNNNKDKDLVYNEFFCISLANKVGLETPRVKIKKTNKGLSFLLVKRFDRVISTSFQNYKKEMVIKRLWQMDFCQKLKVPSTKKYQSDGGPSIKQICDSFEGSYAINKINVIRAVIFNYLIGNNDAHGKNFSILENNGSYVLSPFYDLVSTKSYEYVDKMAMKIGGEYEHGKITYRHFMKMAMEVGINEKLVNNLIDDIAKIILDKSLSLKSELEKKDLNSEVYDKIISIIEENVDKIYRTKEIHINGMRG